MTPLEVMTEAYFNSGGHSQRWCDQPPAAQAGYLLDMRAALLALAECELPDRMYVDSGWINTGGKVVRHLFSTTLRAIAKQ